MKKIHYNLNIIDLVYEENINVREMFIIQIIKRIIKTEGCSCHSLSGECKSLFRIKELISIRDIIPPPPTTPL